MTFKNYALIFIDQVNQQTPMPSQSIYRRFFIIIIVIILLSPLLYWLTGIGQAAAGLPAEVIRQPDGTLISSPKAEALRSLSLPMRIERLLIYPLLLLTFQLSGGSPALRHWLEERVSMIPLKASARHRRNFGIAWLSRLSPVWFKRLIPAGLGRRLTGQTLLIILSFILIFDLALFLLYLPFNFYRGFIVSHQFGLSTQTGSGWLNDWLKSVLIALATDGLLWGGFYGLMRLFPRRWPLLVGALLVIFMSVFTLLTPILITPLFYEVRLLDDVTLRGRILTLTERAGMPVDEVYVIDASSKTTQVNAYVAGFGKARRIVLFDTLLSGYKPDEIEVVLAHEMGHWYYRHVLLSLVGLGAVSWLGLFGLRWLLGRNWGRLGLSGPDDVAGLPYVMAIIAAATILSLPVQNGFSRYGEGQADAFALAVSQKPGTFIALFEQFAEQNLSVVNPPAWEKFIFYTHPPIVERIQRAEARQKAAEH